VSTDAFALLLTAGVQIQQGHPTPGASPTRPFTVDDLIDFQWLLDTADWFTQLQALR
jgi:hypothetical protein